ncbi:MAG TPA: hypothetical protein VGH44_02305 [Candidatus Saccharimonadia bacterium]|jgi:hypothetical protein
MGSTQIQVTGILNISVHEGADPTMEEMLRAAAEHQAILTAPILALLFPDNPEMQERWDQYVATAGLRMRLDFDRMLGELEAQDRQVIAEYVTTHEDKVYLEVKRADRLQRLIRAVTNRNVQQTSVALRKLAFIGEPYQSQLWDNERGLNLTLLYDLLTEPDNSLILAAIYRIHDMGELRAQCLRHFVIACRQRGVV